MSRNSNFIASPYKKGYIQNSLRILENLPLLDSEPLFLEDICLKEYHDPDPIEEIKKHLSQETYDYSDDPRTYIR